MNKKQVISNIVDAFRILDVINQEKEIGTTVLSDNLDIPKTSVYRILKSLEEVKVVKQLENSNYTLDYHILEYSKGLVKNDDITEIAEEHMDEVVRKTGETVNLGMEFEENLVILNRIRGEFYQLQTALRPIGDLYCSGMGKLFLAQWSDEDLKSYFNDLPVRTIKTITSFDGFKKAQEKILDSEISIDDEEYEYGLSCYAVPIYDKNGNVLYSLSISGPSSRLEYKGIDFLVDALKVCASAIQESYLV